MELQAIIKELSLLKNTKNIEGMARFGINTKNTLGISMVVLKQIAKIIGKNQLLAEQLWDTKIHEARILAALIAESEKISESIADKWVMEFDSWDVCDQVCNKAFDKTKFAYTKAIQWSDSEEEFVKRAGFVMIATLAVHDKKRDDGIFIEFLDRIIINSIDERNFVKKAVNWSLRQIGKRSYSLNLQAVVACNRILELYPTSKSARWIARDALRELTNEKILFRIK